MAKPADSYFNPVTRTRLVFVTTGESSGGRELGIDWFVPPGERLIAAPHCHAGPDGLVVEHFELLSGSAGCRIGGKKHKAEAPHTFAVPTNTPHIHPWNTGSTMLHVRQRVILPEPDPELIAGAERFFETLTALSQQRRANRRGDILNPVYGALVLVDSLYPKTYIAYVPLALQVPLLKGVAALARKLGYAPHVMPVPGVAETA
jgi:hypothetical protein